MPEWKLVGEPRREKVGWRTLTHKMFKQPSGKIVEYTTYGTPGDRHGAVIALTPKNEVIIAEQFRPGPEMVMQELPGGNLESGENAQDAVMRELREETGYTSDSVVYLGETRKDAYMNATWHFYLARDCYRTQRQELEETEFVDVRLISIDTLTENAKSGRMSDANAVLMAYDILKDIDTET